MIIESTILDDIFSRVSNGIQFVRALQSAGHTNEDINESIHHFIDTPTLLGEWEKIITTQALKHLTK